MRKTVLWMVVLAAGACSDRSAVTVEDSGVDKGARVDQATDQPVDRAAAADHLVDQQIDRSAADDLLVVDTATTPDACNCKPGEAWANHACVATTNIGCAPTCDLSDPSSCPAGERCNQWGAAACCTCAAAVPACIPDPNVGPSVLQGPLRISPTFGQAGQSVEIAVEGAPFYIGALFYKIRMGSEEAMASEHMKPCSCSATFTPPNPGLYAVEVSQYGGGEPWVLAGFYTASGGSIPMPTIQPGFPCSLNPAPGDPACAQGAGYSCSCTAGRCLCK